MISGPELGRQFEVNGEAIEIGRADNATIRVESDAVSRRHARVQQFGERVLIADLDSTNGTYVNDARVRSTQLREGDQIRVGKVVLKYTECAIEASYHDEIFNRASVDALTGAFNRRYFTEVLQKEVGAAADSGSELSLVVFDIDHFKRINDQHGHPAGDAVLKRLGAVVCGQKRKKDLFCRIGGEEFALLLPESPLSVALGAAELLRGAVELTDFSIEAVRIPVTVSVGVGQLGAHETSTEFYERVDGRLYSAKRGGRNQVC